MPQRPLIIDEKVFYKRLGTQLRLARESSHLNPKQVAAKMGMTRTCIYNWEAGRSRIPFDVVVQLADIYGMRLEDFR